MMRRSALAMLQDALNMAPGGLVPAAPALAGYSALPNSFTLNAVNPTPTFIFRGREATLGGWPEFSVASDTLTLDSSGTAPTVGVASPFPNPADTVVSFAGASPGRGFAASTNTYGNITTEDYIIESIFEAPSLSSFYMCKKSSNSGVGQGWRMQTVVTSSRSFLRDGVTAIDVTSPAATLTAGLWFHVMVFADRTGNMRIYINGTLAQTTAISTAPGSLAGTETFRLGGTSGGNATQAIVFAYGALWEAAGLCSGATAEQDTLALSRFLLLGI